jgi:anti-sigma factor RsiW
MTNHESAQPEIDDELTAYLDGELDAASVRRVEERLARDAAYRGQLQKLERTWDLLDRLPRADVGEKFTKSTLEMVAVAAAKEADEVNRTLPKLKQRQRMAGVIAMAAALAVGYAIGRQAWPDPNEALLRDLPVIENIDLFYQVEDTDFLRELDREHLFEEPEGENAS